MLLRHEWLGPTNHSSLATYQKDSMPLDKNRFDTYLKDIPVRDLAFRGVAWALVSALSAFYAIKRGVPPLENLNRLAESAVPVINSVAAASIFMALFALAAKDLEAVNPNSFGQQTRVGLFGGFFRRVGGDFMLWTLGALVSILTAALVAFATVGVAPNEFKTVIRLFVYLAIFIFIIGGVKYFVRREQPSFALHLTKSPTLLLIGYAVVTSLLLVTQLRSVA